MKLKIAILFAFIALVSCEVKKKVTVTPAVPITGTWKLLTGTLIEHGDTVITDYTVGRSFIKIINDTHFAFVLHDLNQGKDSLALFASGAGRYTLQDSVYTEYLEYCTDRNWEGHDFQFVVTIRNDTLVQSGVEVIESEGINRMNIERYVRAKE